MKRATVVLAILVLALLAACLARVMAGGGGGGGGAGGAGPFGWPAEPAILSLRLARIMGGLAVGGALGAAGIILQTLLRNPLASPDVVGVSAGASFGVMLNLLLSAHGVIGVSLGTSAVWRFVPAAAGASVVLLLLVGAAGWKLWRSPRSGVGGPTEPVTLLLTGVVVSVLCGAGVMFLQYLMPDAGFATSRLLMGSLSDDSAYSGIGAALIALAVCAIALAAGRTLDAVTLPYDEAVSIGVNVPRVRVGALAATGGLCAVAVVLAGPVGFVGLVAPHLARLLLGPAHTSHRVLIPAAAIAGAAVIVLADTLVRLIDFGAGRMPLGILTALIGGPTLIALLRKESHARA